MPATSNDISDFLSSRRGRITPDRAGLPAYGTHRRVTGLRREEVAMLAGISVEYYTRLERGTVNGVSESVLEGIANALQLDDAERTHLFDLARAANTHRPTRRRPSQTRVRPVIQRILDSFAEAPAFVRNARFDVLGANRLGAALYAPIIAGAYSGRPPNTARFVFLDPDAADFFVHWEQAASDVVAFLRAEADATPTTARCRI